MCQGSFASGIPAMSSTRVFHYQALSMILCAIVLHYQAAIHYHVSGYFCIRHSYTVQYQGISLSGPLHDIVCHCNLLSGCHTLPCVRLLLHQAFLHCHVPGYFIIRPSLWYCVTLYFIIRLLYTTMCQGTFASGIPTMSSTRAFHYQALSMILCAIVLHYQAAVHYHVSGYFCIRHSYTVINQGNSLSGPLFLSLLLTT